MAKLVELDRAYWPSGGIGHWCPGCQSGHEITIDEPNASGARWSFDGNVDAPTFSPSINMQINPKGHRHYQPDIKTTVCHYFIRAGRIEFLGDCTHALRGQTVELPDVPTHAFISSRRLEA